MPGIDAGPDQRRRRSRIRLRRPGAGARRADGRRDHPVRRTRSGSRWACSTATASSPAPPAPARPRRCSCSPSSSRRPACPSSRRTSRAISPASRSRVRRTPRSPSGRPRSGRPGRPQGFPVEFFALGGQGIGTPLRVTMTAFGPTLLSKVLGPQRHPGVLARAGLPLRRPGGPAAARPRRPARGRQVPHLRRGQGRPEGSRRSLQRHGRGDPARADRLLRPGCRRLLRRARVRDQ